MGCLLVSFCNVSPDDFALGAYEFETSNFQWVQVAPVLVDSRGVTGIAKLDKCYWVVEQHDRASIVKLDADFRVLGVWSLPISRDSHSIAPYNGGFLIADTAHNRINFAKMADDGSAFVESEFWRYGASAEKDDVHLNSVCVLNGEAYISCFGEKPADGWLSAEEGKVVNITTGEVVCDKLQHPHTLTAWPPTDRTA